MKKVINSENAPKAIGPYSQAIEANGFVFVSGQLPINMENGLIEGCVKCQTKMSLKNIKSILNECGLDMADIVKTTVLLSDMADFSKMNEVYETFFSNEYPARCCYAVKELPKGALVEIECIAKR